MHPLVLSLAIHNHQPIGNFDHVIAEAADRAYAPLLGAWNAIPASAWRSTTPDRCSTG